MLGGRRILIVEDETFLAMELADIVESNDGHVIGPFRTNRQALAAIALADIDAAILDLNLADGEASPTAERLLAAGIPILICTAGTMPRAMRRMCPDLPVHRKPIRAESLVATLSRLCEDEYAGVQAASGVSPTSCLA